MKTKAFWIKFKNTAGNKTLAKDKDSQLGIWCFEKSQEAHGEGEKRKSIFNIIPSSSSELISSSMWNRLRMSSIFILVSSSGCICCSSPMTFSLMKDSVQRRLCLYHKNLKYKLTKWYQLTYKGRVTYENS